MLEQPAAKELAGSFVKGRALERLHHQFVALGLGLALEKLGAHVAQLGHAGKGGIVHLTVVLRCINENPVAQFGRNKAQQFS